MSTAGKRKSLITCAGRASVEEPNQRNLDSFWSESVRVQPERQTIGAKTPD